MSFEDLKRSWTTFGAEDPLWAILTDPRVRGGRWDLDEFFASGRADVGAMLERVAALGQPTKGARALDFGCGVGRLTRALAEHYEEAVGVDVASTMIERGRELNADQPVRLVLNERDDLSVFPDESFDLIYTIIVLQHMDPEYSTRYIREFARLLRPGGTLVFQIPVGELTREEIEGQAMPDEAYRASLSVTSLPPLAAGRTVTVPVRVTNDSSMWWPALPADAPPIRVGNRWLSPRGAVVIADDGRAYLPADVPPGGHVDLEVEVTPPRRFGRWTLRFDAVHEEISWFADRGSPPCDLSVQVHPAPRTEAIRTATRVARKARRIADRYVRSGTATAPAPGPVMEMHCVPEEKVVGILEEAGCRMLAVDTNWNCGFTYHSRTFYATR